MTRPSLTVLHLSDIQLGRFHRFEPGTGQGPLFDRLREDIDEREREGLRPDLAILTGDLAEWGLPSEFAQVEALASALATHLRLPRRRVILLPGNHDINRKACSAYFDQCAADEQKPQKPYWPKWRHFAAMFARFYGGEPDITFEEGQPWSLFAFPELRVVVAALNSTIADSHLEEDHVGFVGEKQLRWFAERLRQYEDQGWLRIGAIHHDPSRWRDEVLAIPEDKRGEARLRVEQDLRDLERFLWPRLNLLLHGHIHEEQVRWFSTPQRAPIPGFGVGSGGLSLTQRPPEVPNQYQWLRIHEDRVEYGSRAYVPDQKRWVGDNRADHEKGERWWVSLPFSPHQAAQTFAGLAPAAPTPEELLAQRVARYRERMVKMHQSEGLFDLATHYEDARIEGGLLLLDIFVPQRVGQVSANQIALPFEAEIAEMLSPAPPEGSTPVEEVLTDEGQRWSFLLGDAGAGKSALTRWLVLKLCGSEEDFPPEVRDLVPVRVELRLFEEARLKANLRGESLSLRDYIQHRHQELALPLDQGDIATLAEKGGIFWVLDGLDEVANPQSRHEITIQVIALREAFPGCRGLLTSRPSGTFAVSTSLRGHGCQTWRLAPFNNQQIQLFLDRWHPLAFPQNPQAAAQRKQRLERVLSENQSVRELCHNPLLLTLVALLNRGDELPRKRHKLYERATELMIATWDANKGLGGVSRFQPEDKWKLLRRIAYSMMQERDEKLDLPLPNGQGNIIEQENLERITTDFCREHYGLGDEAPSTASAMIQHLRERNYVLALLGGTSFGFVHRTFLEYLAAREIVGRFHNQSLDIVGMLEIFKKRFQSSFNHGSWNETLSIILGIIKEELSDNIILKLVQAPIEKIYKCNQSTEFLLAPIDISIFYYTHWVDSWKENSKTASWEKFQNQCTHIRKELMEFFQHPALIITNNSHPSFEGIRSSDTKIRFASIRYLGDFSDLEIFLKFIESKPKSKENKHIRKATIILLNLLKSFRALGDIGRPRRALVKRDGVRVGTLEETEGGGTKFSYDETYRKRQGARAISPVLPLREAPFEQARGVLPFFANLLPEGALLDVYCQKFGLARTDVFGLLLVAARDVAGAVEIVPESEDPAS